MDRLWVTVLDDHPKGVLMECMMMDMVFPVWGCISVQMPHYFTTLHGGIFIFPSSHADATASVWALTSSGIPARIC